MWDLSYFAKAGTEASPLHLSIPSSTPKIMPLLEDGGRGAEGREGRAEAAQDAVLGAEISFPRSLGSSAPVWEF